MDRPMKKGSRSWSLVRGSAGEERSLVRGSAGEERI